MSAPVVGVVMGSDSDWPVMEAAALALDELGIAYEADVVSAHRMPREMIAYGESAADRGLRVISRGLDAGIPVIVDGARGEARFSTTM